MTIIKKGIYKHYKGTEYKVLGEGENSETKETEIIYQGLNDKDKIRRVNKAKKDFWYAVKTYFPHHIDNIVKETSEFRKFVYTKYYINPLISVFTYLFAIAHNSFISVRVYFPAINEGSIMFSVG